MLWGIGIAISTILLVAGSGAAAQTVPEPRVSPPPPAAPVAPPLLAAPGTPPLVVAVIDFQHVVRESMAGRSVRQQVDKRHAEFQSEIKKIQEELELARQELTDRGGGGGEPSDDSFGTKRQDIRDRIAELQSVIQQRRRALDEMFNVGMRQVDLTLVEVLKELAEERCINLILNAGRGRGLVLFAENSIVITEEALERLNRRLPKVELADLPPVQ